MKKNILNVGNLFAVSILLFAFYLNFLNTNNSSVLTPDVNAETQQSDNNKTRLVENPQEYINTRVSMLNNGKKFTPVYSNENSPSL